MSRIRLKWIQVLMAMILMMTLLLPVAVYRYSFDGGLSRDREQWAAMGSAMSGIYGPILSVITLGFLIAQLSLQRRTTELQERTTSLQQRTTELQQDTTAHIFDQAYIQDARADIEFYLTTMVNMLDQISHNVVPRKVLREQFLHATEAELLTDELKGKAYMVEREFPQIAATWSALNSILIGLNDGRGVQYQIQLTSAQQKAIVMLSYVTCKALDNYLFCVSHNRTAYSYLFNRDLSASDER